MYAALSRGKSEQNMKLLIASDSTGERGSLSTKKVVHKQRGSVCLCCIIIFAEFVFLSPFL